MKPTWTLIYPRYQETDIVVKRIRDCLWSSPASPPDIITPELLTYIQKEGDVFQDVIKKLLQAKEVGVSVELNQDDVARTGTLRAEYEYNAMGSFSLVEKCLNLPQCSTFSF